MAYFNEFPHTRSYDSDLGWIIRNVKKLQQKFDRCPTWYGEWVPEIEYPALAFVQYGDAGDTYMSIKPVPPNTPITDEHYWTKTGTTSEQILELQRRMSAAEGRITAAEERITATEEEIEKMKRNKILFVSDSYGNPAYSENKNFCDVFNQRTGAGAEIVWKGSTGFGGTAAGQADSFRNVLDMYTGRRNEIDKIVVVGGANDLKAQPDQIAAGMADFSTLVKRDFTSADVIIVAAGITFSDNDYSSFEYRQLRKISYTNGCALHGWTYTQNSEYTMSRRRLTSDGVHPTLIAGVPAIVNAVVDALTCGRANIHHFIRSTGMEPYSSVTAIENAYNTMQEIDGNIGRIWTTQDMPLTFTINISQSARLSGTQTGDIALATFNDLLFPNGRSVDAQLGAGCFSANVFCEITTNESGNPTYIRFAVARFEVQGYNLYGKIFMPNEWPANHAYGTKIILADSSISVPII